MRSKNHKLLALGLFALLSSPLAQAKDACLQLSANASPALADDCNAGVALKLKDQKNQLKDFLYRNEIAGQDSGSVKANLAVLKQLGSQSRRLLADANLANEAQQAFAKLNAEGTDRENLLEAQLAHAARNIGNVQTFVALVSRLESTTKEAADAIIAKEKFAKAKAAQITRVALD